MNYRRHGTYSAIGIAALFVGFAPMAAADGKPAAMPDTGRLGQQWWQLAMSLPAAGHPLLDDSGKLCMVGQHGSTWFLNTSAGPLGEPAHTTCTIPEGMPIFFPLYAIICNPFPGETIQDNIAICKEAADAADILRLVIDGKVRNDLIQRRVRRSPFPVTLPDENLFGYPAGIFDSVHDGYFALIPPMALGTHIIRARGGTSVDGFGFDIRYRVHIVKPTRHVPLP
ncbi:MAG: hypothetical protein EHM59_12920 [Betaproteobacteria bacterium]|nr:MAG: hypothetical protein EHM59_12920 [Betaproteobacteria bacterium]